MMRASYRRGVEWVALNDESACMVLEEIAEVPSLLLLADLFGKSPEAVAKDVLKVREKAFGETKTDLRRRP